MTKITNGRRISTIFLSGFVTAMAAAVCMQAYAVVETPNAMFISYSVAPGSFSTAISIAENEAVLVMGTQTALGYRGVGMVSMLHIPGSFLEWTGIESPSAAAITSGFSGVAGTHILYLDYSHFVDLEVHSADTFVVQNAAGSPISPATGNVTVIW